MGIIMGQVPIDFINFGSFPFTYIDENGLDVWQNICGCEGEPPIGSGRDFWQEECLQNELLTTGDLSLEGNPLSALTIGLMKDIGYGVNYEAADEFDGSDTTCCIADATENVAASKPNNRVLSDAAKARATEYGLKILRESRLSSEEVAKLETEAPDIIYVGDKFITVFIEEYGNVHGVHVTSNSEESETHHQVRTLSGASSSAHEDTSTPEAIVLDNGKSMSIPSSLVDESHKNDGGSGSPSRSGKPPKEVIVRSEEQPTVLGSTLTSILNLSPLKGRNHSFPKP